MSAALQATLDPEPGLPAGEVAPDQDNADPAAEVEERARRMGWVPREEFRGEPGTWRDAAEFVERGTNLLPVLQQQLRAMDRRAAQAQQEFAAYREESTRTVAELTQMLRSADERARARQLREVEQRRAEALASGDQAAFQAADAERDSIRQAAAEAPPPVDAQAAPAAPAHARPAPVAPEVVAWVQANPWFNADPEAQRDAVALFGQIEQARPDLSLAERLALTRQKVARLHPQHFQNPRRDAPAAVGSSTPSAPRAVNPRSFDAMPAEVKQQFARYAKMLEGKGKPLTKDEWAAAYWEQEG
jgi:hypothetical protein